MKVMILALMLVANIFTLPGTAAPDVAAGQTVFNRNDKVLSWKTRNVGAYDFSETVGFKLESTLSTSLNMTTGREAEDRWYDTVYNRADLTYRVSDKIGMIFMASENWNKDTMSRIGTSLLTTDYGGSIRYFPLKNLSLDTDIGQVFDRRFDNRDSGIKTRGGIRYIGKPLRNMSLELTGSGEASNLKRSRDGYRGAGKISYHHDAVDVSLDFEDNLSRRGYFSDIDRKRIEKRDRREQTLGFAVTRGDFINTSESAAIEFTMDLQRRQIIDTANDNPRSSKYQNNAKGGTKGFGIRIGKGIGKRISTEWDMRYRKTPNGIERLDRRRTLTDIETRGSFAFGIGRADTVEVGGWIKRTRIDTPVGFTNDRDELKFQVGLLYNRYFTNKFKTALDFRVLETHYVNIDVSQSSQNKWLKTFLLSPSLVYSPAQPLTITHAVNLYANYITYDFDSDYALRSNISRRVTSESWIDILLSRKTRLAIGVMFEENDYGRLNAAGDKIPSEEGLKRFGDISIEYRFTDWLTLSPEYVYAIRHDWSFSDESTKPLRREVDQTYGLKCRLFNNENGSVNIDIKRIVRNTRKYPVRIRNYITVELKYGF